uniref:Uncharacterized protein n=1 Tax=Strombidinopsis acuminata TaxID=141414 RepID=A0A7S3X7Y5_9SPIT|mmetsp:Transcript_16082/g.41592  ORF Transcript_16082/g.41592 Transcript_16082/m.41592 type:complete len:143 (-) Transcript_16082:154-582(-)
MALAAVQLPMGGDTDWGITQKARLMMTKPEAVAYEHSCMQKCKGMQGEIEVKFLGNDVYVPRLVASNVKLDKTPSNAIGSQTQAMRVSYTEQPQRKRPDFRGSKPQGSEEPHIFPSVLPHESERTFNVTPLGMAYAPTTGHQ